MTITRERQSHYSGWKTRWRRDARVGERSDKRLWDFYREYAGRGGINDLTGADAPVFFCAFVIQSVKQT